MPLKRPDPTKVCSGPVPYPVLGPAGLSSGDSKQSWEPWSLSPRILQCRWFHDTVRAMDSNADEQQSQSVERLKAESTCSATCCVLREIDFPIGPPFPDCLVAFAAVMQRAEKSYLGRRELLSADSL